MIHRAGSDWLARGNEFPGSRQEGTISVTTPKDAASRLTVKGQRKVTPLFVPGSARTLHLSLHVVKLIVGTIVDGGHVSDLLIAARGRSPYPCCKILQQIRIGHPVPHQSLQCTKLLRSHLRRPALGHDLRCKAGRSDVLSLRLRDPLRLVLIETQRRIERKRPVSSVFPLRVNPVILEGWEVA